jgi:multidrug efflux pump subunit AcrA (membrane-fusion protein)
VTVDVAPALNSEIQLKVAGDAVLYPLEQSAIVPKLTAPVRKFYVERGAHVRAGQLLAELEDRDLTSAVAESHAAAVQADATYETTARASVPQEAQKAELDMKTAKDAMDAQQTLYDRRQELLKEGALSQKDVSDAFVGLSQARSAYEVARKHHEDLQSFARDQEIKAAAAQRDTARAHEGSAQTQLGYARITSPIDGVVTDRPVFAGETPQPGAPLITIMNVSQIIAKTHLSPQDAAILKVGNPANLIIPGQAPVAGKVTQISPALDPTSTTVEVWIQAANPDGRLRPGASMRIEAIAKTVPNALVIPYSAIITGVAGTTSVIVVDADNKPHQKIVTLGIRDGANVEVVSGLQSGDRVVTVGSFELAKLDEDVFHKTKVKIAPPKEEPDPADEEK